MISLARWSAFRTRLLPTSLILILTLALGGNAALAAPGPVALAGSPGRNAGVYVLGPDASLTRAYSKDNAWRCEPVDTWGPKLQPDSLIAGEWKVYGVNAQGKMAGPYLEYGVPRFSVTEETSGLVARSLALGGSDLENSGVYGVKADGTLVRAWWSGKWNFAAIPHWGDPVVPNSLISGGNRVYGVTRGGRLFNTYPDGNGVKFAHLGEWTGFIAGSLALDGPPGAHSSVYAVRSNGSLARLWWAANQWNVATLSTWGLKIAPTSLITGEDRVYGVTDQGTLINTYRMGQEVHFGTILDKVRVVPGSLALGGSSQDNIGVFAVDWATGRLLRFWWGPTGWVVATVPGVSPKVGTMVSADRGIYGLDTAGRLFAVVLSNGEAKAVFPCPLPTPSQQRQRIHSEVLDAYGIDDLGALGSIQLDGNVAPAAGLLRPRPDLVAGTVPFANARRAVGAGGQRKFESFSGTATQLRAEAPKSANKAITLDTAYWAAEWIHLADGTNVVLKLPVRRLVILTEKLTVGKDVTFTYERQPSDSPAKPARPGKPGTPSVPSTSPPAKGLTGYAGTAGATGGSGPSFSASPAPEVEVWVLSMSGPAPAFDLRGQDGGAGGSGGDGGEGGNGGPGSSSKGNLATCKYGPGDGGDGGTGGRAGNGGKGGDGGLGGRFAFYAPQSVVTAFTSGFFITVDGGSAGPGGMPGTPGAGGAGGPVGAVSGGACRKPAASRRAGVPGAQGQAGQQGAPGKAGEPQKPTPMSFLPIVQDDFLAAWVKPAIETVTGPQIGSARAYEGESVTIKGQRFTKDDQVFADTGTGWIPCQTAVVSDTLLTFRVPAIRGGFRNLRVERPGGTASNQATLYVLPRLDSTVPGPRIKPGTTIQLKGIGFAPGARVTINGQEVGIATYVDPHTLDYFVVRPVAGITPNIDGEAVSLGLSLADGTKANEIPVVLDTYVIDVLGDSVLWNVGLQPQDKIYSLVAQKVRGLTTAGNIGIYHRIRAHTGARIGLTPYDKPGLPAIPGEVPTPYPTILEQLDTYRGTAGAPHVDLVVVNGCINDVGIFVWLDPQKTHAQLQPLIEQHCRYDMGDMLGDLAQVFPTAKIVVTGYYAPLGPNSSGAGLVAFLIAIDHPLVKIPGEIVNGVLKPGTRAAVISNSLFFAAAANNNLSLAVQDANAGLPQPRIFFADPKLLPEEAAMSGPGSLIFGVNTDLAVSPEDSMAGQRKQECQQNSQRTSMTICTRASAGHPNAAGARRYADAIAPYLP